MTLFTQDFKSRDDLVTFANGRESRGFFEMFDPRHLTDEQFVTISDGSTVVQFTIDLGGDGVGGGVAVDVSGVAEGDEDALATAWETAINGDAFNVTAVAVNEGTGPGSKAKVELINDAVGLNNVALLQGIEGGGDPALTFKTVGLGGGTAAVTTANIIRIMLANGRWILFHS